MKNIYFSLPKIGYLYLEKVLVEIDVPPLLFVCKGEQNGLYLCVCTDSYKPPYEYLAVETTEELLLQMLCNKITMYDAFKQSPKSVAFKIKEGEDFRNDIINLVQIHEISDEDLPQKGAFFEIKTEYIKEYISELQRCKGKHNVYPSPDGKETPAIVAENPVAYRKSKNEKKQKSNRR
ncbi:DUF6575 domain-containing protein [Methanolapillus millepedarum]|uniref:Uncharacterized protein n=1 Tax=Methanolapillus millepedarum TaxID=3028296 RepID=A0AA96V2J3_9EURY|nr:hypothetical protein MsAc7_07900 [Methanosarcinaceae archaeon Ac7]